jgi:hypothetical protein
VEIFNGQNRTVPEIMPISDAVTGQWAQGTTQITPVSSCPPHQQLGITALVSGFLEVLHRVFQQRESWGGVF